jgi:UDP-glucose 4-epimerase
MRIVVVGASGNVGTSVLRSLAHEPKVDSIVGVCRRVPDSDFPKVEWRAADITRSDLRPVFEGADSVIHLAWLIQPGRDLETLRATNVAGSERVFRAAAAAKVPSIVYASSVGAYGPGPKDRKVDESWPTTGIRSSFYSRHKAEVERILDRFEAEHPGIRVARMRPSLIFKGEAASEIRRLFAGPFVPTSLLRPELIPIVPRTPRLVFQAAHSYDIGEAYRLAAVSQAQGAFNLAADPVLDPDELGRILGARPVPVPAAVLRAGAAITYRLRLQPSEPGWVDMALATPLLDSTRAREELGWNPKISSGEALLELIDGMRTGEGADTPTLASDAGGPMRAKEVATGVGGRQGATD